jgi:hypothetical protein
MDELNLFQVDCEAKLLQALQRHSASLENRRIEGVRERFVVGNIDRLDLDIYIYLDGAEINGFDVDCRFEAADFDSLDCLRDAFIKKIDELLNSVAA